MIRKFILPVLVMACHLLAAQTLVCPPKHDEEKDASLRALTDQLKNAVAQRDAVFIRRVLDDAAVSAFDAEGDADAFMADWQVADANSEFWPMMERVLNLGGTYVSGQQAEKYQFVFPYTYEIDLDIEADYFNIGVVTGKNVNVREEPNTGGKVLGQLTYHVVSFLTDEEGYRLTSGGTGVENPEWYRAETLDRKLSGWVNARFVTDLMGPRLFLYKDKSGSWKISCFVVGD